MLPVKAATSASKDIPAEETSSENSFTFFANDNPQVNVPRWGTAGTESTIDRMNALPGELFPFGGTVERPRDVLVLGDLVDDLHNRENWALYARLFAVDGNARLKFPVYECIGNHDLGGKNGEMSYVEDAIVVRNAGRVDKLTTCPLGYHSSWDWGSVHFVNLNLFPVNEPRPVYDRPAPWNNPRRSVDFLRKDLAKRVGDSGRSVILMCTTDSSAGAGRNGGRRRI